AVFASRMGECAAGLSEFVDWSLFEVLDDEAALGRVDVVQPVLWAVMVSLAAVWEALGGRPGAGVCDSRGESAAAVVAGAWSLRLSWLAPCGWRTGRGWWRCGRG